MKINTLIVDDHWLLIQSYMQYFQDHETIKIIEYFENVQDVKLHLPIIKNSVHVMMLDLKLNEQKGQDLIPYVKALAPHIRILVLSSYDDYNTIAQCKFLGADGYMVKKCSYTELSQAIIKLTQNQQVWPSDIALNVLHKVQEEWTWISELKPNELQFLIYCDSEMTYAEIATLMQKSERTLDNYRDELFRKFGVNTRLGLIRKAMSYNLLPNTSSNDQHIM